MNDEVIKVLRYFDLSDSEVLVYLTCLKLGPSTAYEIAKDCGLKRPTVYVQIDNLAEKGLVTTQLDRGKTLCLPVAPRRIVDMWKGRVEALEAIQPDLNAFYRQNTYQPRVQIFEGEKGVDAVYNELPPLESKGEELLVFGSIHALLDGFDYLIPRWERAFRNKRNPIREIVYSEPGIEAYLEHRSDFENPNYHIRMIEHEAFGKTDNIIYQNKVAIFSLNKELFVTIIESEDIAQTYKALFNAAWATAKVIK